MFVCRLGLEEKRSFGALGEVGESFEGVRVCNDERKIGIFKR